MTVGQLAETRYAFVRRVVILKVLALLVFAALSPGVGADEEHPDIVLRAFSDQNVIARQAAGLVDEGRDTRPAGIVDHGVGHRLDNALERVLLAHDIPRRRDSSAPVVVGSYAGAGCPPVASTVARERVAARDGRSPVAANARASRPHGHRAPRPGHLFIPPG